MSSNYPVRYFLLVGVFFFWLIGENLGYIFAILQAGSQLAGADAKFNGPIGCDHRFAFKSNPVVIAPVSGLLFFRCPPAIFWTIRPIVVDPVDCVVIAWSWTNICHEIGKRFTPSITNVNATFAVTAESRVFSIVASSDHAVPLAEKGPNFGPTLGKSVFQTQSSQFFFVEAFAAGCFAKLKELAADNFFVPAIAKAIPQRIAALFSACIGNYNQTSKSLSGEVMKSWVGWDRIGNRHSRHSVGVDV